MTKRGIRQTIELGVLPNDILHAILISLRDANDPTDYLVFFGKHVGGLTLFELGERFSNSPERMRQRLKDIHERIKKNYESIINQSDGYIVTPEGDFKCQSIVGTRATSTRGQ